MNCENNFYSTKGLCYTSGGEDYVELVRKELGLPKENGETPIRLDADKAAEYKKQAMEELSAIGVTFPVMVDYYIAAAPDCFGLCKRYGTVLLQTAWA